MSKALKRKSPWVVVLIVMAVLIAAGTIAAVSGRVVSYVKYEKEKYSPISAVNPVAQHDTFSGTKIVAEDFNRYITWVDEAKKGISLVSDVGFAYHLNSKINTDTESLNLIMSNNDYTEYITPFAIINNVDYQYQRRDLYTFDFDVSADADNFALQMTPEFRDVSNKGTYVGPELRFKDGAFYNREKLIYDYGHNEFHLTLVVYDYDLYVYLNGYFLVKYNNCITDLTYNLRGMRFNPIWNECPERVVSFSVDNVAIYSFTEADADELIYFLENDKLNLQRCPDSLLYGGI